jgi:hypothetical protein
MPFPKVYASWGYKVHKVYLKWVFYLFKLNLTIQILIWLF